MEKLILQHYIAQVKRGKITRESTVEEFIEKLKEEFSEFIEEAMECVRSGELTPSLCHEGADVMGVLCNLFTHLNIDIIAEYKKNVAYQIDRED